MSDKRILFISQEIAPYVAGSEADFARSLVQNAHSHKFEVRTFMPRYGTVNERRNQLHEVIRLSGVNIPIDDNDHPLIIKVASLQPQRIQVYFIDNDDYFQKDNTDIDPCGSNRPDNDERAIFYARGTIETVKKLRWVPKVIFANGWMSALSPLYLRAMYTSDPAFKGSKIVYCVTRGKADVIDPRILEKMQAEGISKKRLEPFRNLTPDTDMLHRMAIHYSDAVVVADPDISPELMEYIEQTGKPFLVYNRGYFPEEVEEEVAEEGSVTEAADTTQSIENKEPAKSSEAVAAEESAKEDKVKDAESLKTEAAAEETTEEDKAKDAEALKIEVAAEETTEEDKAKYAEALKTEAAAEETTEEDKAKDAEALKTEAAAEETTEEDKAKDAESPKTEVAAEETSTEDDTANGEKTSIGEEETPIENGEETPVEEEAQNEDNKGIIEPDDINIVFDFYKTLIPNEK